MAWAEAGTVGTITGAVLLICAKLGLATKGDLKDLTRRLEKDESNYLEEKTHKIICRANTAELKEFIGNKIDEKIDAMEERIVKAIKQNGHFRYFSLVYCLW